MARAGVVGVRSGDSVWSRPALGINLNLMMDSVSLTSVRPLPLLQPLAITQRHPGMRSRVVEVWSWAPPSPLLTDRVILRPKSLTDDDDDDDDDDDPCPHTELAPKT